MSEVKVTQADCGAAAALKYALDDLGSTTWSVRSATAEDHPVVQAFARHRQSATTEALAAMEQAREALELAEGLHSWLAHRFGVKGPEYSEVAARSKKTAASLATLTEQIERMRNGQG